MTDLTLRPSDAPATAFAGLALLLKEIFSATPAGMLLAIVRGKR